MSHSAGKPGFDRVRAGITGAVGLCARRPWLPIAVTLLLATVSQPPIGWAPLAWVAWVPWLITCLAAGRKKPLLGWTAVLAVAYYLGNLYWLIHVTIPGYLALSAYLAGYIVLLALLLRSLHHRHPRWPMTLLMPLCWVGQEFLRSRLLTGFPWFFLAHSQHDNLHLLQVADIAGAYGITFLVAMVNGLLVDGALAVVARPGAAPPAADPDRPGCCGGSGPTDSSPGQPHQVAMPAVAAPSMRAVAIWAGFTVLLLVSAVVYGHYRLKESARTAKPLATVSVVQDVIPIYVHGNTITDEEVFARYAALTEQAIEADPAPQLVVWPETMVTAPLNNEFLTLPPHALTEPGRAMLAEAAAYDQAIRNLARGGVALMIGSTSVELAEQGVNRFNSAFLYPPDGSRPEQRYDKIHLVPFGEIVPFQQSWPWLYRLLMRLTPYTFDYSLRPGDQRTVFRIAGHDSQPARLSPSPEPSAAASQLPPSPESSPAVLQPLSAESSPVASQPRLSPESSPVPEHLPSGESVKPSGRPTVRFAVAICYEDVMARVIRRHVYEPGNNAKRVDFLANISNDGWFVHGGRDGEPVRPTAELAQHLAICRFRAVENRIGVVRAVNVGISGFIRPDGRLEQAPRAGTLPANPWQRQTVPGFLTDTVYGDTRTTFYARVGDLFAIVCLAAFLLLVAEGVLHRTTKRAPRPGRSG